MENLVDQTWLCKYPRPTIIVYNRRNEFLSNAFKNYLTENEYGIKYKCETMSNPQYNSILEMIHQVISNLVCKSVLQNKCLYEEDPW